ncbi:MAG: protein-L-isoaspartate(D-aspartate) O-methyltransferase [Fuerstiella sp.]
MNQTTESEQPGSDPFAEQRQQMVMNHLRGRGLRNKRVLAAMAQVPREEFVLPSCRSRAYSDCALPIEYQQTISQPFTVAFMCEMVSPQPDERVLEIGTGSGYGAAVLSRLAAHVHTVEQIPELADSARARLQRLGFKNVTVHCADGSAGLPEEGPFDVIVVTAAAAHLPAPYEGQLTDGGRIIIPLEHGASGQSLVRFNQTDSGLVETDLGAFTFVPLIGRFAR